MKKLNLTDLNRISENEFKLTQKNKIIVILENIRSMQNVGSVFRSCDAFLIEKIILAGITPTPPHREIHKSALGAENTVDWLYVIDLLPEINKIKNEGYTIIGIEQTDESTFLQNYTFTKEQSYCFVFGNEVEGVRLETLTACDLVIEIPQFGTKHSLNVSNSTSILLWEAIKQMNY